MSISNALANALSGLLVSSKRAELVSANVANVMTEGFARRELNVEATNPAGASVTSVSRVVNEQTITDRRMADADLAHSNTLLAFHTKVESLIGTPLDDHSLSARFADFEAALDMAISRPDLENRLQAVSISADRIASKFNNVSDAIQEMRRNADAEAAKLVSTLSENLDRVAELNRLIIAADVNNHDAAALFDQRQTVIDEIAEIVPVRVARRDHGEVALFSHGGAILLDGAPAELAFSNTPLVTAHMSQENELLSEVMYRGRPAGESLSGGALEAVFKIRDELAPKIQNELDKAALDLSLRFQDPNVDHTLGPSQAALFTDEDARVSEMNVVGLSGRLKVSAFVSRDGAFDVWKLRDGLGALSSGEPGQNALLSAMKSALRIDRVAGTASLASVFDLAAGLETNAASNRIQQEKTQGFASAKHTQLKEIELSYGVDTDAEMQNLLVIEQAYAANARVVQTLDELMETLLRM
ncbi:flagellar hook-associated protein FlgK [Shimia sp. SDUM112013]|uniref:flagellar hook-associated protein FlgK n=1 Tax=Shimia sp. SDUM112013 TaxID=3136160 RepID=UPI0032EFE22F